jgi:CheY-like chemotaxis protein
MPDRKLTVLLADDDEVYVLCYKVCLEDAGFEVITAKTRFELLDYAPMTQALVVDACLPSLEMEGIEAVAELLDENQIGGPRIAADVPIIFNSGYGEDTPTVRDKLRGYPVLANRYEWVCKDGEIEVLIDAINRLRRRRRR